MAPLFRLRGLAPATEPSPLRPSPLAALYAPIPRSAPTPPSDAEIIHSFVRTAENELGRGLGKGRKIWLMEEVGHLAAIIERIDLRKSLVPRALDELARTCVFAIHVGDVSIKRSARLERECDFLGFPLERVARWVLHVPVLPETPLRKCERLEKIGCFRGAQSVRVKVDVGSTGPGGVDDEKDVLERVEGTIQWVQGLRLDGAVVGRGEGNQPMVISQWPRQVAWQLLWDVDGREEYVVSLRYR